MVNSKLRYMNAIKTIFFFFYEALVWLRQPERADGAWDSEEVDSSSGPDTSQL